MDNRNKMNSAPLRAPNPQLMNGVHFPTHSKQHGNRHNVFTENSFPQNAQGQSEMDSNSNNIYVQDRMRMPNPGMHAKNDQVQRNYNIHPKYWNTPHTSGFHTTPAAQNLAQPVGSYSNYSENSLNIDPDLLKPHAQHSQNAPDYSKNVHNFSKQHYPFHYGSIRHGAENKISPYASSLNPPFPTTDITPTTATLPASAVPGGKSPGDSGSENSATLNDAYSAYQRSKQNDQIGSSHQQMQQQKLQPPGSSTRLAGGSSAADAGVNTYGASGNSVHAHVANLPLGVPNSYGNPAGETSVSFSNAARGSYPTGTVPGASVGRITHAPRAQQGYDPYQMQKSSASQVHSLDRYSYPQKSHGFVNTNVSSAPVNQIGIVNVNGQVENPMANPQRQYNVHSYSHSLPRNEGFTHQRAQSLTIEPSLAGDNKTPWDARIADTSLYTKPLNVGLGQQNNALYKHQLSGFAMPNANSSTDGMLPSVQINKAQVLKEEPLSAPIQHIQPVKPTVQPPSSRGASTTQAFTLPHSYRQQQPVQSNQNSQTAPQYYPNQLPDYTLHRKYPQKDNQFPDGAKTYGHGVKGNYYNNTIYNRTISPTPHSAQNSWTSASDNNSKVATYRPNTPTNQRQVTIPVNGGYSSSGSLSPGSSKDLNSHGLSLSPPLSYESDKLNTHSVGYPQNSDISSSGGVHSQSNSRPQTPVRPVNHTTSSQQRAFINHTPSSLSTVSTTDSEDSVNNRVLPFNSQLSPDTPSGDLNFDSWSFGSFQNRMMSGVSEQMKAMDENMRRMQKHMEDQFKRFNMNNPTSMSPPMAFPPMMEPPKLMAPPSVGIEGMKDPLIPGVMTPIPDLHSGSSGFMSVGGGNQSKELPSPGSSVTSSRSSTLPAGTFHHTGTVGDNMELNRCITHKADGKKELQLKFDMQDFSPEEISVKKDKNKLEVHAHHEEKEPNRVACKVFHQQYHLPKNVRLAKMEYDVDPMGTLTVKSPLKPRHNVKWEEGQNLEKTKFIQPRPQ